MDKILKIFKNRKNIKILCYGDSITYGYETDILKEDQVNNPYPKVLEEELMKIYPSRNIKVINKGYNGWTSKDAVYNIDTILNEEKYDMAIIMFGINDVGKYYPVVDYLQNIEKIVSKLKEKNIEMILMTPTPTDYFAQEVQFYGRKLIEFGQKNEIWVLDVHSKIEQLILERGIEKAEYLPDYIHFATNNYKDIACIVVEELK